MSVCVRVRVLMRFWVQEAICVDPNCLPSPHLKSRWIERPPRGQWIQVSLRGPPDFNPSPHSKGSVNHSLAIQRVYRNWCSYMRGHTEKSVPCTCNCSDRLECRSIQIKNMFYPTRPRWSCLHDQIFHLYLYLIARLVSIFWSTVAMIDMWSCYLVLSVRNTWQLCLMRLQSWQAVLWMNVGEFRLTGMCVCVCV